MSDNITMADVAPYYVKYQEKYGEKCTLSVDLMEELLGTAADDNELLESMHAAMTSTDEDEVEDMTGSQLPTTVEPGSAYSYAIAMDQALIHDIDVLGKAAIENKRGAAVIMLDLFRCYGQSVVEGTGTEEKAGWPRPGVYRPGHGGVKVEHASDNEPWDKEETTITKVDGTSGKGVRSFYQEVVDFSAYGQGLLAEKDQAKKIVGDARKTKRHVAKVETKRTSFKSALVRATKLAQKMAFVNAHTGMHCEVEMEDDKVAESNKLIFIQDKTAQSKFDVITIGQFLALKVSENATYQAIVGTTQRAGKSGTGPTAQNTHVNNIPEFDEVTAAYAGFFDKLLTDPKASVAVLTHLNAAGSDDLLLSLNKINCGIDAFLAKPGIARRLTDLLAVGDGSKRQAMAEAFKSGPTGKAA